MIKPFRWKDAYGLWKNGCCSLPEELDAPVAVETIDVGGQEAEHYFCGYDWVKTAEVPKRKQLIQQRPREFFYFTRQSGQGIVETAERLAKAYDQEERAAIWIAATAKELCGLKPNRQVARHADALYTAACEFLRLRDNLWHPETNNLVPEFLVPWPVVENLSCQDAGPVMGIIQLNTLLLRSTWRILHYASRQTDTCSSHPRPSGG